MVAFRPVVALVALGVAAAAASVVAGGSIATPRFCTCTMCPADGSNAPSGCKGGRNIYGYPEVAENIGIDASPLLRSMRNEFQGVAPHSGPPRALSCDDLIRPDYPPMPASMLRASCEATTSCAAFLPPYAAQSGAVSGYVRWDAGSGYWVPTSAAGTNITGAAPLANDMCPYATSDARDWARFLTGAPGSEDFECLCAAIREAQTGLHHGNAWANASELPAGVHPLISYPEDDCYCPPAGTAKSAGVSNSEGVMWAAPGVDAFVANIGACVHNLVRFLVIQAEYWRFRGKPPATIFWPVVSGVGSVNCSRSLSLGAEAEGAAASAADAVGAATDGAEAGAAEGSSQRLRRVAATTTGDDDDPPQASCTTGCPVHACQA